MAKEKPKAKKSPKSKAQRNKKVLNKMDSNKKALIEALEKSLGVVTAACQKCGIARSHYYNYLNDDPEFFKQVADIQNIALDFVESKLYKQIQTDNLTATIFYLKTKGRGRGYSEHETGVNPLTGKGGVIEMPAPASIVDWEKMGTEAMERITKAHKDV